MVLETWKVVVRKIVGPEYGEGAWEFSDSATGVERGRRPARRMVRRPRHRRVMERVRERYISRSERGFSGDNMVEGAGGGTCGPPGIGRKHCDYQFGRYEERNSLEGEPCGCTGGVCTDAVHDCEKFGNEMVRKNGVKRGMSTTGDFDREDEV